MIAEIIATRSLSSLKIEKHRRYLERKPEAASVQSSMINTKLTLGARGFSSVAREKISGTQGIQSSSTVSKRSEDRGLFLSHTEMGEGGGGGGGSGR